LYAIRVLGLSPGTLGVLIAAGGIGALAGAFVSAKLPRRYGLWRTMTGALLVSGGFNLLIPAAGVAPFFGLGMLLLAQLIGDAAMMVYGVNEISLRQMLIPERLLGRANASIGFLTQGIAPIGALVAGVLAGSIGELSTLWIAGLGILIAAVWTRASGVREGHLAVEWS
jgi:predicted MFS family arabinose efflux permease